MQKFFNSSFLVTNLTAGDWVLVFSNTKEFYIQFTGLLESLFVFVL